MTALKFSLENNCIQLGQHSYGVPAQKWKDNSQGKDFNPDGMLWPSGFVLKTETMVDHFLCWLANHPNVHDYAFVLSSRSTEGLRLVFNLQSSQQDFLGWIDRYKKRFGGDLIYKYPKLPEKRGVSGTVISRPGHKHDGDWAWVMGQCAGQVWFMQDALVFEDEKEATMFLLSQPLK